jgi:Transposase
MNSATFEKNPRLTPNAQKRSALQRNPELTNIVKVAIRIIAGSEPGEVVRAARFIGVSEPTLYRWRRAGNMREARGAEVLRVHELTALPVELLLRG